MEKIKPLEYIQLMCLIMLFGLYRSVYLIILFVDYLYLICVDNEDCQNVYEHK